MRLGLRRTNTLAGRRGHYDRDESGHDGHIDHAMYCAWDGCIRWGRDRTRQNLERVDNEPPNLGGSSDLLIEVDRERARTGIRHGGLHKHSSPIFLKRRKHEALIAKSDARFRGA
jgi:hypothetical protein